MRNDPLGRSLINIISPMTNYAKVRRQKAEQELRRYQREARGKMVPHLKTAMATLKAYAPEAVAGAQRDIERKYGA